MPSSQKAAALSGAEFYHVLRITAATSRSPKRYRLVLPLGHTSTIRVIGKGSVMELDRFDVPARLAELLKAWGTMTTDARNSEAGRVLVAEVRGIGQAAAFFGGWKAMQTIDWAASAAGAPNTYLNDLWDGIGAWVA